MSSAWNAFSKLSFRLVPFLTFRPQFQHQLLSELFSEDLSNCTAITCLFPPWHLQPAIIPFTCLFTCLLSVSLKHSANYTEGLSVRSSLHLQHLVQGPAKTNVCSMHELQELWGGTFHAFIISKAGINILSQQRRESVSLLTGCPAMEG